MSQWFIYIARCADKTLYTGITTDVDRRIKEHNQGKLGARYTRARRPVRCIYTELHEDRSSASKREAQIKKLSKNQKLSLIAT